MESVPHVLFTSKKSHIHLRKARAKGKRNFVWSHPKISLGFLQSIIVIWLFSNLKTALCTVLKHQVAKLQFL